MVCLSDEIGDSAAGQRGKESRAKMSKKKQPKNGFFYYMKDMQDELRLQGKDIPMREMSVLAGPRWSVSTVVT